MSPHMLGRREGGSQGLGVLRGLPQLGPRRLGASSRAPRPVRLFPTKPLRLASNLIRRTSNPPCLSQAGASLAGAARLRRGAWDSRSLLYGCLGTSCRQRWSGAPTKAGHRSGETSGSHLFLAGPLPSPLDAGPRAAPAPSPSTARGAGGKAGRLQGCRARAPTACGRGPPWDGPQGPHSVPVELVPLKEPAPGPRSRAQG